MKRTGCWLLAVMCSVLGGEAATDVPSSGPECLLQPWHTCVQNDIKVRDTFYHNMTCICTNCRSLIAGVSKASTCATLSQYGAFPPAQWVALRSVPVGNVSSQTLQNIHPSSLTVLVFIDAGISTVENKTFARFPHLRSVYLDFNALSQLKRASFSGLNTSHQSLAHLSFPHNRIAKLEPGCFEETPYLTMLDLSHNLLSEVASEWFRGLAFLHTLFLGHNKIEFISATAFDSLYNLRVLNVSHNPLTCLSERILSGPSLQTFSVGGERKLPREQDDKMNWSLTVDKTDFLRKKQKVRLRIDNLGFCLTYTAATRDFQLRWAHLDLYLFKYLKEPECSSLSFGPIYIRPPFVVATALKKPKSNMSNRQLLASSDLCPEAWTRHDGMTLSLKGGAGLQLVGIHNTEKPETSRSDGIALISRYMHERNPGFVNKSETEPSGANISCFVFFRGEAGRRLPLSRFPGAGGGPYSECPDSKFPKDHPNIKSNTTNTESNTQTTDSATGYLEKSDDKTSLTTMIVHVQDPYRTLIPLIHSSVAIPIAKGASSPYLISLIVVPGLVILTTVMVCKYRRTRNAAQNVPVAAAVQADPCHQFIDVTQLVSNRMYKTSNEALILAQASGGTDLTGQGTNYRSSVLSIHTYYEIKDEDVDILPDTVTTDRRFSTASTNRSDYEEIKDEDVYDPTTSHTYSEIRDEDLEVRGISVNVVRVENRKLSNTSTVQTGSPIVSRTHGSRQSIDVTDLISNPMYKTSSAQPDCTDPKEQSTCQSSALSTHSYCEIDDDDVYDPSSTHFYSEIKDDDCP